MGTVICIAHYTISVASAYECGAEKIVRERTTARSIKCQGGCGWMADSKWVGLLVLLMGLAMASYGTALFVKPDFLCPRTPLYRWVYWRWFADREGRAEEQLTNRQIRFYAAGTMVTGLVMFVIVLLVLLRQK